MTNAEFNRDDREYHNTTTTRRIALEDKWGARASYFQPEQTAWASSGFSDDDLVHECRRLGIGSDEAGMMMAVKSLKAQEAKFAEDV